MASSQPAARTRETSKRKKASARDELLRVVSQLMIEKRTLDVSFVEISARSGLASALIKYYFGSKQGLLHALVSRDAESAVTQLNMLRDRPIPAPEKLRIHIRGIINTLARAPYLNQLVQHLANSGETQPDESLRSTFIRPIVDFQRELIEQGVREGTMRPIDPFAFFFVVFGACDHIFSRSYALQHAFGVSSSIDDELLRSYVDSVVDIISNGVVVAS